VWVWVCVAHIIQVAVSRRLVYALPKMLQDFHKYEER